MPPTCLCAQISIEHLTDQHQTEILYWGAGLILLVLVCGFVLTIVRRRIKAPPGEEDQSGGFSLADLKQMRASNQLTEEEYQVARAKLLARFGAGDNSHLQP